MSIVDSSTSEKVSQIAEQLRVLSEELRRAGRYDLLLEAITVSALQQLNIEAAKERLSPLVITSDYRFLLPDYEKWSFHQSTRLFIYSFSIMKRA